MRQFNSILVYRGASQSYAPVKIAARIAAASGAHVTLGDLAEPDSPTKQDALNITAARMRRSGVSPSTVLLQGEAPAAVVECIVRDRHDLLMMNLPTRDIHDPDRATTTQLVTESPVSVLLVRELRRRKVLRILAAVDSSTWDSRDRDNLNSRLIRTGAWLARNLEGRMQVLHVWQPVGEGPMRWAGVRDKEMTDYYTTGREHVLRELTTTLKPARVPADQVHVETGDPRALIPKFAEEQGIDLMVIGTFARSGLSGRILGNTAHAILDLSPCSMLIVPRSRSS